MDPLRSIIGDLAAWLCLSVVAGLVVLAIRFTSHEHDRRLLPPSRLRAIPWGGLELLALFVLLDLTNAIVHETLLQSGFLDKLYGPDFTAAAAKTATDAEQELRGTRIGIWSGLFTMPIQAGLILVFLRGTRGLQAFQIGLSPHRWRQDIAAGYLAWLVMTPFVTVFNVLVGWLLRQSGMGEPEQIPFLRLVIGPEHSALPSECIAIALVAVAGAPFLEELLFRGVIQSWAVRRAWAGDVLIALSFIVGLALRMEKLKAGWQLGPTREGVLTFVDGLSASLYVLALVPGYVFAERLAWPWLPLPHVARGIYATSLLFATMHANVWPSPIALFPFALVVGFLAVRTQSLIGPIFVHALFNGTAVVAVTLTWVWPDAQVENGKEATSAGRVPPAVSTTTTVPGASAPRRMYPSASAVWVPGTTADEVIRPTSAPSRSTFAPVTGATPD